MSSGTCTSVLAGSREREQSLLDWPADELITTSSTAAPGNAVARKVAKKHALNGYAELQRNWPSGTHATAVI
eukprot:CAMPEP_0179923742 /NCGR_PEP_ID=MMETSP0983-20121128/6340_1 /TAXON_ID=483367 /ORGANISM="non described non described, Strain CCMP 2436" /LENGTH=71 /DNA_ID=CAMNT_0021827187 /DNA_START=418 /DNA_END=630 /DNA_ORIENTATION=-